MMKWNYNKKWNERRWENDTMLKKEKWNKIVNEMWGNENDKGSKK